MKQFDQEKYNDYELVYLAKEHHEIAYEILQKKYEPIIVGFAKRFSQFYNNIGLDIYDYVLEGRFALDKAINSFDEHFENMFFTHAINYIRYYLYLLVKNNKKDICLNNSIAWTEQLEYLNQENFTDDIQINEILEKIFSKLTKLERRILILKIRGYSYEDIAKELKMERKKIDNTLSRIRRKLKDVRKE